MTIEFTLIKEDLLQLQLFMASISEQVRKARRKTHLLIPVIYMIFAAVLLITTDWFLGIVFISVGVVWYFVYPSYQAKQYKKVYSKHVDESQIKRTLQPTELTFEDEYITGKDYSGESKFKINIVERIDEVRDYCFLKLNSGSGLVIPVSRLSDREGFVEYLKNMAAKNGIEYKVDMEWKWK